MRGKLLGYIVCPQCQGEFKLHNAKRDSSHIMEGMLRCETCHAEYAIHDGVPILLDHAVVDEINKTTAQRFGQEWDDFDFIHPERYAAQFLEWIAPVEKGFFHNKLILDAGCGKGRHCVVSEQFQACEIIGVDLAEGSVRAAFRNTRDAPNIHIIQGNLYQLPFKENTFEYIYSIGVLHHTPDPKQAFNCLVEKLTQDGSISAWVYGREGNWWILYLLNPIRTFVTSKLPLPLLKMIAFFLTLILHTALKLVYIPVNEIRILKPLSRILFYNDYLYSISHFPFRENYSIVFDHLLPEIAHYVPEQEFRSWFAEKKLDEVIITRKTNNSWRGTGKKVQA